MLSFKISFSPTACNHHLGAKNPTIHIFFTILEVIGVILCVENHDAHVLSHSSPYFQNQSNLRELLFLILPFIFALYSIYSLHQDNFDFLFCSLKSSQILLA